MGHVSSCRFCALVATAMVDSDNRLACIVALGIFATGVAASLLILAHDRPFTGEISIKRDPFVPGNASDRKLLVLLSAEKSRVLHLSCAANHLPLRSSRRAAAGLGDTNDTKSMAGDISLIQCERIVAKLQTLPPFQRDCHDGSILEKSSDYGFSKPSPG
jgi:hypothetical protein